MAAAAVVVVLVVPGVAEGASGVQWRVTAAAMPTNLPPAQREMQEVHVYGEGGTFTLSLEGDVTAPIAYDASAAEVATALNALGKVSGPGGKVVVSGGPGGAAGGTPYQIVFSGSLSYLPVAQLVASSSGLTGATTSVIVTTPVQGGDGEGSLRLTAINVGSGTGSGVVSLKAGALPSGVTASSVEGEASYELLAEPREHQELSCVLATLTCTYDKPVGSGESLAMEIHVTTTTRAPGALTSSATVEGDGAEPASVSEDVQVSATPAPAGLAPGSAFSAVSSDQAGGRPDFTNTFTLSTVRDVAGAPLAAGSLHDVSATMPPGLVGNTVAVPRCSQAAFYASDCSTSTMVGTATLLSNFGGSHLFWGAKPLYNLQPSKGQVVELGYEATEGFWVLIFAHVRTGGDYGITAVSDDNSEGVDVLSSTITVWGVPADNSGSGPFEFTIKPRGASVNNLVVVPFGGVNREVTAVPLFTNPTSCEDPFSSSVEVDFWQNVGAFTGQQATMEGMSGCEALSFDPSLTVTPETQTTTTATGLRVDLRIPQDEDPNGLGAANVKDTVVQLPEGMTVNPSQAAGLVGCQLLHGTGALPGGEGEGIDLENAEPAHCPPESKIGTVEIDTPLVDHPLSGAVYVARQNENPFGSLLALYIAVYDPITNVVVKVAGNVQLDPGTGRLTTTFDDTPELPFEDFKLDFFGGEGHAPLVTPGACGSYTVASDITPWSTPYTPDATPSSQPFAIDEGCGAPPFSPGFTAGTSDNRAGGFSPFTLKLSRQDDEQQFKSLSLTLPRGASAILAGVPECGETEANAGTCSSASQIGETSAQAGVGEPITVTGGKVYLTGPYQGAPFGLAIVVPAVAGPFNLGNVVIRATIAINPITAQATVTTNPTGAGSIPSILDGIPLDIRTIYATIDRQGFTFNPTNCSPLTVTGSVTSTAGSLAAVASHFQATNCAALAFKPTFKISTAGKTGRLIGASLNVKLTYPQASIGNEANVQSVKVELPKQLPSNLKTLQKACPAATFEINPAACDPESRVGTVLVHTPILPVPLTGPAYFVSYGGAKFPELIFALQGDGVTVYVHAETLINEKTGITSSTLHNVPDVPFETFELTLPQGQYSALSAPSGLCNLNTTKTVKKKVKVRSKGHTRTITRNVKKVVPHSLVMPTEFIAQNGTEIHQNTPITVIGCTKTTNKGAKHKNTKKTNHATQHK